MVYECTIYVEPGLTSVNESLCATFHIATSGVNAPTVRVNIIETHQNIDVMISVGNTPASFHQAR